jgi:hypothetical protein
MSTSTCPNDCLSEVHCLTRADSLAPSLLAFNNEQSPSSHAGSKSPSAGRHSPREQERPFNNERNSTQVVVVVVVVVVCA